MSGTLCFLFALQGAAALARRRDRRLSARDIAHSERMNIEFEQALGDTKSRIDDLYKQFEDPHRCAGKKIVSELKVLESLMREFAGRVSHRARAEPRSPACRPRRAGADSAAPAPIRLPRGGDLLETIRASLEENRVDLYLQPIVSLPQRKLRYYEALSRLRAEDGKVIMPAQYINLLIYDTLWSKMSRPVRSPVDSPFTTPGPTPTRACGSDPSGRTPTARCSPRSSAAALQPRLMKIRRVHCESGT